MKPDSPIARADAGSGRVALATGFVSAILASTCCLGPLVLITLGFSGAWISNLTALEPYRPIFIGAALVALFLAGRRIWAKAPACEPGQACAVPSVRRSYKLLFGTVVALVIVALGFPLAAPWFY
ncbi:mercuric ion transporter MerT [Ralstonia mannitolilytica]|uniref:mercuric ion transporter MerT n=1 Tax=Ralstonia mannitolilytica TaxID=105219 RepID=UPI00374837A2